MNQLLPTRRVLFYVIALFLSFSASAQLPAFTFNVTATNETCLNNGSLSFVVSGTVPGATMSYAVYLLPNTSTPVITTTTATVPGLGAGSYSITATQTLNGQTSTNTQTAQISNMIVPLSFTLNYKNVWCGSDGTITAVVTSGNAVSYEITAGPVLKPLQASPAFTGLLPGLYTVRAFDNCGEAQVVSVTLLQETTGITIGNVDFSSTVLTSCTTMTIENKLVIPAGSIFFEPLTVQYTVFPPGGGTPIVITKVVTNLSNEGIDYDLSGEIPYYNNQAYSYNLKITDACGNVYNKNGNPVLLMFGVSAEDMTSGCGDNYFNLKVSNFSPPFTVNFLTSPAGFNPVAANTMHPTFSSGEVYYGGPLQGNVFVPEGTYTAQVTDACNRVATVTFTVQDHPVPSSANGQAATCNAGGTVSVFATGRDLVTVMLLSAPPAYSTGPFPMDISALIVDGQVTLTNVPPGEYVFSTIDECNYATPETGYLVVFQNVAETLVAAQRPGCEAGLGSLRIENSGSLPLTTLTMTAAPAAFAQPLPFNMLPYVATDGRAYINSLPPGSYTFTSVNQCGGVMTRTVSLSGYATTVNDFNIVKHCGAFDIQFQHLSNGTYTQNFYLQKYNTAQGTWEHPQTGIDYAEGTQANSLNSIPLVNNGNNLSYPYTGLFRVIKTFFVYDNGTNANIRCYNVLYTFSVEDGPVITDAYSFPCETGLTEVAIIAEGIPPFTYSITTKDGQPFLVNNGQSNLFTGLESAIYNFKVTDDCGYVRNIQYDIDALETLSIQAQGFCEGEASSLFVPGFEFMDYKWYKEGAPATVLSTSPTLNFPAYNSATQSGIYHVSITTDNPLSCMNQDLSFSLAVNALPDAGADTTVPFCNDGVAINLKDFLGVDILTTGEWEDLDSTGLLTNSTLTTAPLPEGIYHFKYTVHGLCDLADDALLTLEVKNKPQAPIISSNTPVCENETITLAATTVAGATYAWTGPNGFTSSEASPVLTDVTTAATGTYSLTVTVNGCASNEGVLNITVNASPKAGDDAAVQLCNEGNAVNLEDYLTELADTGGVWEDVDAAGTLNGSTLATEGVAQGTYHFKYTVTNICNTTDEAFVTLELKDIPQPPTVDTVAPVCEGTDVQLNAGTITNAAYSWTGPNGFTSAEQNPLIAAAGLPANGNYSLTVTVNDCTSVAAVVTVTVYALPQFSIDGNTVLCEGQTSELTIVPDNFNVTDVDYTWYLEGAQLTETSGKINISQIGQYEVSVNNNNCTTNLSFNVTVNSNPFDVVLDSGCINYEYSIWVANIADIDGAVVTWTGPDGFTFTGTEANITNLPEGDYTATVTNSENCTANATLSIDNTSCIIPRGVSPNDDGLNDNFDLSNLDVREIKIFNRYGLKVYEAKKYLKEWHGQSDKGTLPTATYYYVITLSAGKQVTGWVYLQREE